VRFEPRRVLISFGGGPRAGVAQLIARELCRRHPSLEVLLPAPAAPPDEEANAGDARIRSLTLRDGLGAVLHDVDLAVLGGGMSLYEAAAAGVPAVALAVVPAQRPTIQGLARAGVVRSAGRLAVRPNAQWLRQVVGAMSAALADVAWRRAAASRGPRLVDGRGAERAARAITALLERAARA